MMEVSPARHDSAYWRSYGDAWRWPAAALAAGFALGFALLVWTDARRIVPDEVGLGVETWAQPASYLGRRINAWRLEDYSTVYDIEAPASSGEVLWVGNSQLHAINQLNRKRDQVAPFHASSALGQPVYCLSLPNANVQEHLATLHWAMTRRPVRYLVLPMVFDKLRNDGLRPGFERLASPALSARLATRPQGKRLEGELADLQRAAKATGTGTNSQTPLAQLSMSAVLHEVSLQEVSERALEDGLASRWGLWQRRPLLWSTVLNDAYVFRNWLLGIKATSKRPMLPVPFENNMAAFDELLDVAAAEGIAVLVYIAPIRQDVEPPYIMAEYRPWKAAVARNIAGRQAKGGAKLAFADLDQLVPAGLWGTADDSHDIDFMHFQGKGHEILGGKVAQLLQDLGVGAPAQAGTNANAVVGR